MVVGQQCPLLLCQGSTFSLTLPITVERQATPSDAAQCALSEARRVPISDIGGAILL
jgi:hypothetical protein